MKTILFLIVLFLMCGTTNATPIDEDQHYIIAVVVWDNVTGLPEADVLVTFGGIHTLHTAEDGSVIYDTANLDDIRHGEYVTASCKYGTKLAPVVLCTYEPVLNETSGQSEMRFVQNWGMGLTFNEPSESTALEAFAALGFAVIAFGGGRYILRRKKNTDHKGDTMTEECPPIPPYHIYVTAVNCSAGTPISSVKFTLKNITQATQTIKTSDESNSNITINVADCGTWDNNDVIRLEIEQSDIKKTITTTIDQTSHPDGREMGTIILSELDIMTTYTKAVTIQNSDQITVHVPVEEPNIYTTFLDFETPIPEKTIELLSEDESTILQTTTTNHEGVASFAHIVHGNYSIRITY